MSITSMKPDSARQTNNAPSSKKTNIKKKFVAAAVLTLAKAADASSIMIPGNSGVIPFASFDAGSRSYSLGFSEVITDLKNYCNGRTSNAPRPLYDGVLARCNQLANFSQPASRDTAQLLVSTGYNNCGKDFLFTDVIDATDPIQACIANISTPAGGQAPSGNSASRNMGTTGAAFSAALFTGALLFV